jgi:hypothetical protein
MADRDWTRRRFTVSAAAVGVLARAGFGSDQISLPPRSQSDAPEIVAGGVVPLRESNVARPMRYRPDKDGLVIRNGSEFFNRPLYGPNIPFRVDAGDLPEFSLYLPGHGGNLRIGVSRTGRAATWLHAAAEVLTHFSGGRVVYDIRDPLLGTGHLRVEALTIGAGFWVQLNGESLPPDLSFTWAFAGVSGRKGKRSGDIGCESEPVGRFFQVRPEECQGNVWTLDKDGADVVSGKLRLRVKTPPGAELRIGDGANWHQGWDAIWNGKPRQEPAFAGRVKLTDGVPAYVYVSVVAGAVMPSAEPSRALDPLRERRDQLRQITQNLSWRTPDPHLDSIAGSLCVAADALWDETQGCVMHGGVAWRMALAGWRGPYVLDLMGQHERMKRHLRRWIARQNISDVTNGNGGTVSPHGFEGIVEAAGKPDPGSADARSEGLLHSNGDLSHNHYDMNLVFFDALLRHLRWTGDLGFAREIWPALVRHAAWERRLFRREFGTPEQTSPLYEAYAAIWASDNLQYNGGGAAHSSAYNVFLNRGMAELAELLNEPAASAQAHRAEADAIGAAMRKHLWMPHRGAFAESRDWLGERALAENPAVWTVYHTVDGEFLTPREAWQTAAERLRAIRRIPVVGEGVPAGGWLMACSDWMPYVWSLTLITLGENLHMSLALFQAGLAEEGYGLLRGSLLDACYRGLCPGNFPMSLQLDPHRQESQRDFGDPIGCATRAIVEGLWGVQPRLLQGRMRVRPQLPESWEAAELNHPDLTLRYRRQGAAETWEIASRFAEPISVSLQLPARTVELPQVKINGAPTLIAFDPEAVGRPMLLLELATGVAWRVSLESKGAPPNKYPRELLATVGEPVPLPDGLTIAKIDDPQGCLDSQGAAKNVGRFTVFAAIKDGACQYWLPIDL